MSPVSNDWANFQSTAGAASNVEDETAKKGVEDWKQIALTTINLKEKSELEKQVESDCSDMSFSLVNFQDKIV